MSESRPSPVPRLHPDGTIVCIGGGPSLTQEDVDRTQGQVVIAINDGYQMAPHATYHYFCDSKWWAWHKDRDDYKAFQGQRITQDEVREDGIWRIAGEAKPGLSLDPARVHFGSNSGFQVLNLAVLMGASRILLLGYDMKIARSGLSHWFGDHPDKVRSNYMAWLSNFSVAAEQCEELGIEVINCSPDTALICFRQMSLASALSLGQAPALQQNRLPRQSSSGRSV